MWDIRQDPSYARYINTLNWTVDKIDNTFIYTKRLPFTKVSIVKIQRPPKTLTEKAIKSICVKEKAILAYIEPSDKNQAWYFVNNGFKKCKTPSLPSKTVRINLQNCEDKLLGELHYKTRYNIKLCKRNGLAIRFSRDIEKFAHNWQKSAKDRGMWLSQKREIENIFTSFGKRAHLLLATINNKPVGGIMLLFSNKISYYMYAYSTTEGKKLFAPTFLAWNAVLYSKEKGNSYFDFEGIYDERFPLKSWKGFTRFKKSFGGVEIVFPGVYAKYFNPLSQVF